MRIKSAGWLCSRKSPGECFLFLVLIVVAAVAVKCRQTHGLSPSPSLALFFVNPSLPQQSLHSVRLLCLSFMGTLELQQPLCDAVPKLLACLLSLFLCGPKVPRLLLL